MITKLLFTLTLQATIIFSALSQQIQFDKSSIGLILNHSREVQGTGFVAAQNNLVITNAHVVHSLDDVYYYRPIDGKLYPLQVVNFSFANDIAILLSDTVICESPLKVDSLTAKTGDRVFYIGFDNHESLKVKNFVIMANTSFISGVSQSLIKSNLVHHLNFQGIGIKGYSGSPIFNEDGKVIAILTLTEEGVRNQDKSSWFNIGFSLEPIIPFLRRQLSN